MNAFTYRDGLLCAESVPVPTIADAVGTPFYCYAATALENRYRAFSAAFHDCPATICYAMKANCNLAVLRTFAQLGAGADVVSGGELSRARAAGIPPERIVFSGVGKTQGEIADALRAGIHQLNAESVPELYVISAVASDIGVTAPVALRINPDVDANTHAKISTGRRENKFGIDAGHISEAYRLAVGLPGIEPVGLAVHIGSQLTDLAPFRAAFDVVAGLVGTLRAEGYSVSRLDLGGGLGVPYEGGEGPPLDGYARVIREIIKPLGCDVTLEPGRFLVAEAGVLVTRVLYRKDGLSRRFLIVDAAMNDLIRPSLYDAYHPIIPVRQPDADSTGLSFDVVGPVCETGDTFAKERQLPPANAGDLMAFLFAGAYGAVMASQYNARPLIPEVMIRGRAFATVRRRPSVSEQLALESVPVWLDDGASAKSGAR